MHHKMLIRRAAVAVAVMVAAGGTLAASVPASALSLSALPRSSAPPDSAGGSAPADAERIVVIGEEYVLGDLLALGVEPIAATATVPTEGFHALDDYDTSVIEPLAIDTNLEHLAELDPDLIVTLQYWLDQVPEGSFEAIAPTVVVPDGLGSASQITFLGEQFDAADAAAGLVAELEEAQAGAVEALDGVEVSVAAIYSGPTPAVFVDGPWVVPQLLIDAGAQLVPTAGGDLEVDQNGRVYLSTEQLGLLSAPHIVLMQSDLVEGESDAVDQLTASPLWSTLPAVASGDVHVIDRLGYPGIEGHIRAIDDLVGLLSGDGPPGSEPVIDTSTEEVSTS